MASDFASGTEQDNTEHIASDSSTETNDVAIQVDATAVKYRMLFGSTLGKWPAGMEAKSSVKYARRL